jgi:hypothetical protein
MWWYVEKEPGRGLLEPGERRVFDKLVCPDILGSAKG